MSAVLYKLPQLYITGLSVFVIIQNDVLYLGLSLYTSLSESPEIFAHLIDNFSGLWENKMTEFVS